MTFLLEDHLSPEQLSLHVEKHYSVQVEKITKLDLNVFRLDILIPTINNTPQSWVARVHPPINAFEPISKLSEFLVYLHQKGFPTEIHPPTINPVTLINENEIQGKKGCIFVTEFAEGTHPERNRGNFYCLGQLLGRLHSLPVPLGTNIGGAWHHLSFTGGFKEEVHAAIIMLETFAQKHNINESDSPDHVNNLGRLYTSLHHLLNSFDTHVLPTTLVHPDFAPVNIILREEASEGHIPRTGWTVIDWTGAGVGVRVLSLGHLLACAAGRGKLVLVNAVMKGYSEHVHLEPKELEWLPQAVYARLLTIQCWEVAMERKELAKVADGLPALFQMGEDVASRVREILSTVRN